MLRPRADRTIAVTIRQARAEDIPALLQLGRAAHAESAYAFLPFDENKALALAAAYLQRPADRCVLLAERGGAVAGFIAGLVEEYFFSTARMARDTLFIVDPPARGSAAARRLAESFAGWAQGHGAREIQIGISSGRKIERAGRFLQRLGYQPVGGLYKRRVA